MCDTVADQPLLETWSSYAPDGLLGDILAETTGGSCADRVERIGG